MDTNAIFDMAERHAHLILAELAPDTAEVDFERIIGVLVLLCLTKPGNDAARNINHMIHDASWRLTPVAEGR